MIILNKTIKILIIIFFNLCCWSLLQAQNESKNKTDLEGELLKGKVKSLKEKRYRINNGGKQDTILSCELIYRFNNSGLLEERKGLGQLSTYKYNLKNQPIEVNVCNMDGKSCTNNVYYYDDKGNLIVHLSKLTPSTTSTTVYFKYFVTYYSYDKQNKLIEIKEFSRPVNAKKDVFVENKKFEYDTKGNRIVEKELTNSGNVIKRVEHKYSDTTLIESFIWLKFEGENLYLKDIYSYFKSGKIKSKTSLVFEYNSTQRIAQKDMTNYKYVFDNNNRMIKTTESSTRTKVNNYYDFDAKNNWQKMIENDNGEVIIILRQFEYYE